MVHVVRDPVEVLISGYLYHRRLPLDERWLFRPAPELGGRSYADHLGERRAVARDDGGGGNLLDDELRMLVLAYRDVERDPRAMNVQLENSSAISTALCDVCFDFCCSTRRTSPRWPRRRRRLTFGGYARPELRDNEHFTQAEDREPYRRVIREEPFLNKTMSYMRYAMGYVDEWPATA